MDCRQGLARCKGYAEAAPGTRSCERRATRAATASVAISIGRPAATTITPERIDRSQSKLDELDERFMRHVSQPAVASGTASTPIATSQPALESDAR